MPQITIAGEQFEVGAPYAEGHVLTAIEAGVLNQTFLENVRNNCASKINAAKKAAEEAKVPFNIDATVEVPGENEGDAPTSTTLRRQVQDYASAYTFQQRQARTSEPVDPVEREAMRIARDILSEALKAQGIKRKDLTDEQYDGALGKIMAQEKVVAEAKRRVKGRESIGSDALAGLGLGAPAETEAAA
jgi:hypothetical protein